MGPRLLVAVSSRHLPPRRDQRRRPIHDKVGSRLQGALRDPGVTLSDDPIIEYFEDRVRTENGTIEADVIILANGYSISAFLPGDELIGRGEI